MPISNWDDLRIFMAVGRAGGIAAAGRALRLDHSIVVRRLAGLEEEMGARLADRLPTGVRLTAAGLELLSHVERLEAEAQAAYLRLSGVEDRNRDVEGKSVRVQIGISGRRSKKTDNMTQRELLHQSQ